MHYLKAQHFSLPPPLNTGELTVSLPVWPDFKASLFDSETPTQRWRFTHAASQKFALNGVNVKNMKGTFFCKCLYCQYPESSDIVQSRSTSGTRSGRFIPSRLAAVSDGGDSPTRAPAKSAAGFALMFEGIGAATAHAGTTSGSSPPNRDN